MARVTSWILIALIVFTPCLLYTQLLKRGHTLSTIAMNNDKNPLIQLSSYLLEQVTSGKLQDSDITQMVVQKLQDDKYPSYDELIKIIEDERERSKSKENWSTAN